MESDAERFKSRSFEMSCPKHPKEHSAYVMLRSAEEPQTRLGCGRCVASSSSQHPSTTMTTHEFGRILETADAPLSKKDAASAIEVSLLLFRQSGKYLIR